MLQTVLRHPSQSIRSLAFSLLISLPATTRPYSKTAFDLLRLYLPGFHTDSDARFRYELLGHSKDMVKRIKGAASALRKNIARKRNLLDKSAQEMVASKNVIDAKKTELKELTVLLAQHDEFLAWYLNFLIFELLPTASYQRHFTALKALECVVRLDCETGAQLLDKTSPTAINILNHQWCRLLFDRLMDPFDDVRDTATTILKLLPAEKLEECLLASNGEATHKTLKRITKSFTIKANSLASQTGRADHADGVARVTELSCVWSENLNDRFDLIEGLLGYLNSRLDIAALDIGVAIMEAPVHGLFSSIK